METAIAHVYVQLQTAPAVVFAPQEEQAVLEKIVRARRASLAPGAACGRQTTPFTHHGPPGGAANPHILVSEPSVGDFDEPLFFFGANGTVETRRSSTQSMGPVAVPVSVARALRVGDQSWCR